MSADTPRRRRAPRLHAPLVRAALERPWAVSPEGLRTVIAVASGMTIGSESHLAALAARAAQPLDNTRTVTIRDGVATIPIRGILFRYGSVFSDVSGTASYGALARDLTAVLEDPEVREILLDVNSPGGEVDGCGELAGMFASAAAVKPVTAYVGGDCQSAAYWLASAASRIVAAPTAIVGCLGVRMSGTDTSEQDAMLGIREIDIVSSRTPKKRLDIGTPEGVSQVLRTIDALADVMLGDIARYRAEDPETIAERYGAGDVLVGAAALDAGMIDSLGTYEGVHADLVARVGAVSPGLRLVASRSVSPSAGVSPMAKRTPGAAAASTITAAYAADAAVTATVDRTLSVASGDAGTVTAAVESAAFYQVDFGDGGSGIFAESELTVATDTTAADGAAAHAGGGNFAAVRRDLTAEDLQRLYPAAAAEIATAAATAERDRILAIQALPVAGAAAATLAASVAEGLSPEAAALRVLRAQGTQRATGLAALQGDEAALAASDLPSPLGASEGAGTVDEVALILAAGRTRRPSAGAAGTN